MTELERVLVAKVLEEKSCPEALTGCVLWTGNTDRKGYGRIRVRLLGGLLDIKAHRAAFELVFGDVPSGLWVLHSCDVSACVNPAHLRAGTAKENTDDMLRRGRESRGERHSTKLSREQARYALEAAGTCAEVANQLGVSKSLVSLIRQRRRWKVL